MVSSPPQVPPSPLFSQASHSVTGSPPSTAIFLSLPWAKNATHRPSGEKNGKDAPSVADSGVIFFASQNRKSSTRAAA